MSLHSIRPRHLPERELQVDDAELLDLTRLGFVVDTKATTDDGLRRAAEAASEQAAADAAQAPPRRSAPRKSAAKPAGQSSEPETSDSASTDDSKEG